MATLSIIGSLAGHELSLYLWNLVIWSMRPTFGKKARNFNVVSPSLLPTETLCGSFTDLVNS